MIQERRKNPDPPQKLIDLSTVHKHSSMTKSVHNFLRYFAHSITSLSEVITRGYNYVRKNILSLLILLYQWRSQYGANTATVPRAFLNCAYEFLREICKCNAVYYVPEMTAGKIKKNPFFRKSPTHCFLDFIGFWALLAVSDFFYLNEQLGRLLRDLAHQLSLFSPVL